MKSAISFAVIVAVAAAGSAWACGITTHQEITERTRLGLDPDEQPLLRPLLDRTATNVEFGSVFPDLFWGLDIIFPNYSYRAVGRYTHGETGNVPFNGRFSQILREQYEFPFADEAGAMAAAMMLGIGCHQAADHVWHPGFIPAAFAEDGFDEPVVEMLTDLFCEWEQGERAKPVGTWVVPAADLYAIYQAEGFDIGAYHLELGAVGMRIALWLEKQLGPSLYVRAQSVLPWTRANYEFYPDGGLEHCRQECAEFLATAWDGLMGGVAAADLAAGPAPVAGGESSPVLVLALQLLLAGAVDVPVSDAGGGFIEIGEPVVINPALFQHMTGELTR